MLNEATPLVFVIHIDDDVRQATTRLLRSADYHVEAYGCAQIFLEVADFNHRPACALIDLQLPDRAGLILQQKLRSTLPIVFMSGHRDVASVVEAMKGGATEFLLKPVRSALLLDTIGRAIALSRELYISRQELVDIRARVSRLTPRERQVMTLVVAGYPNKQVADALGAAEKTIKVHRARVMEKMKARSLPELVRLADKVLSPVAFHRLDEEFYGGHSKQYGLSGQSSNIAA